MQLKALAVAAFVLCAASARAQEDPSHLVLDVRAELTTYVDSDHVTVVTPSASIAARDDSAGWNAGARYLVDAVSAASVDIVASASRRWSEVRHEVAANGGLTRDAYKLNASLGGSFEPDYVSVTGNLQGGWTDPADRFTLALGYTLGHDTAGRTGTPFGVFERLLWKHGPTLAASIVLDAASLVLVSTDVAFESGDQSKPYRYVPMFDARAARRLENGASLEEVNDLRRAEAPLERLPMSRTRYAFTARYMRRDGAGTLRAEERVYVDTWGLFASSTDVRYAIGLGRYFELAPSLRLHAQTGASFWKRAYVVQANGTDVELPSIRTGDRELGPLWTVTAGADLRVDFAGVTTANGNALVLRAAGMRTAYLDALYIESRLALLATLSWIGTF